MGERCSMASLRVGLTVRIARLLSPAAHQIGEVGRVVGVDCYPPEWPILVEYADGFTEQYAPEELEPVNGSEAPVCTPSDRALDQLRASDKRGDGRCPESVS